MNRALIAGAGIAGLAAALALAKAAVPSVLFERAAALEEFGAGLQLSPNATRVLAMTRPNSPRSTSLGPRPAGARPISSSTAPICSAASSRSRSASRA